MCGAQPHFPRLGPHAGHHPPRWYRAQARRHLPPSHGIQHGRPEAKVNITHSLIRQKINLNSALWPPFIEHENHLDLKYVFDTGKRNMHWMAFSQSRSTAGRSGRCCFAWLDHVLVVTSCTDGPQTLGPLAGLKISPDYRLWLRYHGLRAGPVAGPAARRVYEEALIRWFLGGEDKEPECGGQMGRCMKHPQ